MNNAGFNQYKKAKPAIIRRPAVILATWVAGFASLGLLFVSGKMLSTVFSAFRSCSDNNGLFLATCGKRGLNIGDLLLICIFLACMALTFSLFTAGMRMVKARKA